MWPYVSSFRSNASRWPINDAARKLACSSSHPRTAAHRTWSSEVQIMSFSRPWTICARRTFALLVAPSAVTCCDRCQARYEVLEQSSVICWRECLSARNFQKILAGAACLVDVIDPAWILEPVNQTCNASRGRARDTLALLVYPKLFRDSVSLTHSGLSEDHVRMIQKRVSLASSAKTNP